MKVRSLLLSLAVVVALTGFVVACARAEPTPTPTATPTPAPRATPTATLAPTATPTATPRPAPGVTIVATPTPSPTPTATPRLAATPTPTSVPVIKEGKVVVVLGTLEHERWLPLFAGAAPDHARRALYDTLAVWTPYFQEPRLAESWELSNDFKTFTMRLRKGIKFHDGDEFIAEDVIGMFDLMYEKENLVTGINLLKPLWGATREEFRRNVRATDNYTVQINTKLPYAQWLQNIIGNTGNQFEVPNASHIARVGISEASANPIGTGPFKFDKHQRGEFVRLTAVENHWRKTPAYRQLEFRIIPEYTTQLASVATGRGDIMSMAADKIPQAKQLGVKLFVDDSGYNVWYTPRGQIPPDNPKYDGTLPWVDGSNPDRARKVRQALNLAIDRKTILDKLYGGTGVLNGLGAGNFPGTPFSEGMSPYPYDPQRAKALLVEAGYPQGFEIEMAMHDQAGGPVGMALHEAVADYWKSIGVKVRLVSQEWALFRTLLVGLDRPSLVYYWYVAPSDPDPMQYYNIFYHKSSPVWFGSDALEKLLDAANAEVSDQARLPKIRAINRFMYDNYNWVPMFVLPKLYATSQRVDQWLLLKGATRIYNLETIILKD